MEYITPRLPAIILRLLNSLQHRNDHFEVTMVDDRIGHLRVVCQPLHTLDCAGEYLLTFKGFHQIQQIAAQPVCICLHGTLGVNGDDPLAAPARHPEFLGLPCIGFLLIGGLSVRSIGFWFRLRYLLAGAPAAPCGRRAGLRILN